MIAYGVSSAHPLHRSDEISNNITVEYVELIMRTSDPNLTTPERILASVCGHVPPELRNGFYEPLEMLTTALGAFLAFSVAIATFHVTRFMARKSESLRQFFEMDEEREAEAQFDTNKFVSSQDEATHCFFWVAQIGLCAWFINDYLSHKLYSVGAP